MSLTVYVLFAVFLQVSAQVLDFQQDYLKRGELKNAKNFSWKNCGNVNTSSERPLVFKSVNMEPDPLRLTGVNLWINVTLEFELKTELGAGHNQIEIDLSLRLKTPDGFMEICELEESVCHYNNLCTHLDNLTTDCKKYSRSDLCKCPFKPRNYTLPRLNIKIKSLPFLLKGSFEGTVFVKQQGKNIGCLDIKFCVTQCMY